MNKVKPTKKIMSVLMTLIFIFTLMGPITDSMTLNADAASVTIKTQKAANKYFNNGAIKGIDVSKWQGGISWSKVASDDIKFAFIRSSYGTNTDPYFVGNAQAAHKNGIKVGAYHYACFKDTKSMKSEAAFFVNQLRKVNITYPVVLDLENHYGLSRSQLTKLAMQFMNIVEKEGYTVMLYSYQNFIDQRLSKKDLAKTNLWVANYLQVPSGITHKVWQHTSAGKVKGISGNVDINVAYEDLSLTKGLTVNRTISNSIHKFLNETYGSGLSTDGSISIKALNTAIMAGIQRELINVSGDDSITVDGVLTSNQIRYLADLDLSTVGNPNLIKLLQSKIFYTGYYKEDPSGIMDTFTTEAIGLYQQSQGISKSLVFCENTIAKLLNVKLSAAPAAEESSEVADSGSSEDGGENLEQQEDVIDGDSTASSGEYSDSGEIMDK